jgi:dihydrofolate reductase
MNAVPKLVATRTLTDTSAWTNSRVIEGDVVGAVKRERRDVIITGSLSVVHALMAGDLIDEYRLLTFPHDPRHLHGAPCHLITELEWDTMDELRAAFASAEGRATAADAARLQELAPVRRMIFTADDTMM